MLETIFEAELMVAMQLAHNVARKTNPIEISINQAAGFVLAEDILAQSDLPPFAASRVDGYAVSGPPPWKKIGSNLAGSTADKELSAGEAMYVATGAEIPVNTQAIIKQEDCDVEVDLIRPKAEIDEAQFKTSSNVRPRGYEAKANETLLTKGTKLSPALLGLVAAGGYTTVLVQQKPSVDVLIFGDELVTAGASGKGKVRDSIGPQVKAWLDIFGGELKEVKYVADNLVDHISAISNSSADLIITTGGTASGPADHLHRAILECSGNLLVDAVLVRPGYHQLIAQLPDKALIGLPGNPQSAVIGLLTLARPYLAGATGQSFPTFGKQTLATDISAPKRESRFVLCQFDEEKQNITAVDFVDSSMLRGFSLASGYAVIKPGGQTAGEQVNWLPLP